jgi:5'(3')-deoxyribonucleotidase
MVDKRTRIGIDLDGCMYDFADSLRHYLESYEGLHPDQLHKDATHWGFYEDWGLTDEEFLLHCNRAADIGVLFGSGGCLDRADEDVRAAYAAGHEIHIITDRGFGTTPFASKRNTMRWLLKMDIPFHSLTFAKDKTVVRTDVMCEDKPANYEALVAAGTDAYLIDRPWNQDCEVAPGRRVASVGEFLHKALAT